MSIFLSPTNAILPEYKDVFGYLVQPRTGLRSEIVNGATYAMDNDCFNGGVDVEAYIQMMTMYHPYKNNCLFVTLPDVVGDYKKTLNLFNRWQPVIRIFGFPAALVTQDGLTPDNVPWDSIAALFIGGTDEHKRGTEGARLIMAAKERGKWVHVGRVNGAQSIEFFWLADSWDGNTMSYEPDAACRILGNAVRAVNGKKERQYNFLEGIC